MEKYDYSLEQIDNPAPAENPAPAPAPERRRRGCGLRAMALVLCLAIVAGAAGFGGAALYGYTHPAPEVPANTGDGMLPSASSVSALDRQPLVAESIELTPEELYEAVLPSCVGITVSTTVNIWGQTTTSAASGSGFILTSDGYIATNYHVIEEAAERSGVDIQVTTSDGARYTATLVGGDEDNDVAVIKIDASGLTPVTLGSSGSLRVAQWVCTVGNPLGELTFSFSDGRVSALDRVISTDESTSLNMLQTNCAINPGNSGGPLFDGQGRVVGIVTAKYTNASSGVSAEGLGFAIPIDDVKDMFTDIMEHGYVTGKPMLGVSVADVSAATQRYGVPAGASVESVTEGSAADRAGIQSGDIITAVDGQAVASSSALSSAHRAGDSVTVTVYRRGETLELTAVLDEKVPEAPSEDTAQDGRGQDQDVPDGWPFGDSWPFGDFPWGWSDIPSGGSGRGDAA